MELDGLNRRVKEPGWTNEDKEAVYSWKDKMIEPFRYTWFVLDSNDRIEKNKYFKMKLEIINVK